jgi:acetyl esterase/lipase
MSNSNTSDQTWQPDHVLALWPTTAPQAQGTGVLHEPQLTVHLPPPALSNGCGIIVNPGGGYRILASDHEGLQVARWLNQYGIAAFVLRYRVGPTYPTSVSLLDAQRAVRLVRSRAVEFALDVHRIGMLGFSAGGHLALAAATKVVR